uniref:Density-regulated protein n=2 Tax=Paramormyrops kingsleyae TaxID=1676925 RepID=A0A3B3R639_9TELE
MGPCIRLKINPKEPGGFMTSVPPSAQKVILLKGGGSLRILIFFNELKCGNVFILLRLYIMATTENAESGSPENKAERRTGNSDTMYPLKVLYCGVCSLPTEYCEYMPEPAKCRQWLEKNFPDEFAKMVVGSTPKQDAADGEAPSPGEEEEKKKQKRGGRGQIKQKKKTVPQKVTIAKIPRAKKKYVTRVCGLNTFGIDLKEAQRFFAQKFSCGASVTAEDEIIIQGDFTDEIIDVIQDKWPEVDDDSIEDLGEVKK